MSNSLPTLAKVRQMIARSNDLPLSTIQVEWTKAFRLIEYPTGYRDYRATVAVSAPGYRARTMNVYAGADGIMVR